MWLPLAIAVESIETFSICRCTFYANPTEPSRGCKRVDLATNMPPIVACDLGFWRRTHVLRPRAGENRHYQLYRRRILTDARGLPSSRPGKQISGYEIHLNCQKQLQCPRTLTQYTRPAAIGFVTSFSKRAAHQRSESRPC